MRWCTCGNFQDEEGKNELHLRLVTILIVDINITKKEKVEEEDSEEVILECKQIGVGIEYNHR